MNTKTNIALASVVLVSGVSALRNHAIYKEAYENFPNCNHKVVRKTIKVILHKSVHGEYGDFGSLSDIQKDEIFVTEAMHIMFDRS